MKIVKEGNTFKLFESNSSVFISASQEEMEWLHYVLPHMVDGYFDLAETTQKIKRLHSPAQKGKQP